MILRGFLLFVAILSVSGLSAQSEPQFSQHMFNRYLFNPAYNGSNGDIELQLLHRSQYVGLSDRAISTQAFNFGIPIFAISSGLGLTVINDLAGYQRSTYMALNYNYRKPFKWGNLAVGVSGGVIQTSIDGSKLRTPGGDYEGGINHNDAALSTSLQQGIAPDFSVGVYFNSKKYYAGLALNHIALSKSRPADGAAATSLSFSRNLFFSGGYSFRLHKKLSLMPSVLLKTDFRKVQTDFSVTFEVIDNILTGLAFRGYEKRSSDAFVLFLGGRYKGFRLVYSYDANLSYLSRFNGGSHEISFGYAYTLKKKEVRGYFYHNPRFN